MERENDVQLIRKILSGNDEAFGALVRKHQTILVDWHINRML